MSDIVREARAKARKGDTQAMIQLAEWYYFGSEHLEISHIKSFDWMLKAAEHGHAGAQNGVGCRYETGDGVGKDMEKAFEWYRKAVEGGDADACFNLALLYDAGAVTPENTATAAKLYEEGAARGSVISQYRLGHKYLYGSGVRQDVPRALELLEIAGASGYGSAFETLGVAYLDGMFLPRSPEKAHDYFSRSLAHFDSDLIVATGNTPLLFALCLLTGTGCTRDRKAANDVLNQAAEAGNAIAEQVARDHMVRDPLVYTLFLPGSLEKPPEGGWDISTLMLSKFA